MENQLKNYTAQEVYEANCRIAAYNRAEEEFEEDLVLILLAAQLKKKKRSAMFTRRPLEGTHTILIDRYLMDDDTKFQQYFRLTPHLFVNVLGAIKDDLERMPTSWVQRPITPAEKLCITLR